MAQGFCHVVPARNTSLGAERAVNAEETDMIRRDKIRLGIMDGMACKSRVEPRSCGGAVAFSSFEETDKWIAHS